VFPLLVRVDDLRAGGSRHYAFDRSPVHIGRNQMNDVVLDAPFISQWHGLVRFDEATTEYRDLGSTNGTLANGSALTKQRPVQVAGNVELRVSTLRFYCWRGEVAVSSAASRPDGPSLGPWSDRIVQDEKRARSLGEGGPGAAPAAHRLQPLHDSYRAAFKALMAGVRDVVAQLPPHERSGALLRFQRDMPALAGEEEFRALAELNEVAVAVTAPMSSGPGRIVDEFARALVPELRLISLADVEKLLVRAATTLETSARALVELRQGQRQFRTEMAVVRTAKEMTPLHRAQGPADVLAYLLDPDADVNQRIQELTSAYADIMIHQVALLNGIMEGVRGLLRRLSPHAIDEKVKRSAPAWARLLAPFWTRWRAFVTQHREYSEEDRQLSEAVFGAEFAQGYGAVFGDERGPDLPAAENS